MISLIKKENNDYCVKYIGNTMNDYMNYTAIIGNLSSKFYSNKYMCWMCNEADAAKIKYQITSGQNDNIGAGLKLKPYAYQRSFQCYCTTIQREALLARPRLDQLPRGYRRPPSRYFRQDMGSPPWFQGGLQSLYLDLEDCHQRNPQFPQPQQQAVHRGADPGNGGEN